MVGFVPRVEKFHLEVGQPVFLPGQNSAIFVEYLDSSKDRSLVIPIGEDKVTSVFTLTLRPNKHLADRILLSMDGIFSHHEAPPGMEHVVRALKKETDVDNPFAVAWAMKKRGQKNQFKGEGSSGEEGPGAKSASDESASALTTASPRQVGIAQSAIQPQTEKARLEQPGGVVRK